MLKISNEKAKTKKKYRDEYAKIAKYVRYSTEIRDSEIKRITVEDKYV